MFTIHPRQTLPVPGHEGAMAEFSPRRSSPILTVIKDVTGELIHVKGRHSA
jgi:hypothetical protein